MPKTKAANFLKGLLLCPVLWSVGAYAGGVVGATPLDQSCPIGLSVGFGGFSDVSVAPFHRAILVTFYNSARPSVEKFVETQVIFPDVLKLHVVVIVDGRYERARITDKFDDGTYQVTLIHPYRDGGKNARVAREAIRAFQTHRWMRAADAAEFQGRLSEAEEGGFVPPDYYDNRTPSP